MNRCQYESIYLLTRQAGPNRITDFLNSHSMVTW